MPLGTEVGPVDFVFDEDPVVFEWDPASRREKGAAPTIFGPRLLWPNGWMDQHATC